MPEGTKKATPQTLDEKLITFVFFSAYCHRYAATIAMSALSVMAVTLAPLGILSHVVTRRIPGYNENEVQVRLFRRGVQMCCYRPKGFERV